MSMPLNGQEAQAPAPTAIDPGNPLLGAVPARLVTEIVNLPIGQRLALSMLIPNGRVTGLLTKDEVLTWADYLRAQHAAMNGLIIPG